MTVIIIEDEAPASRRLTKLIHQIDANIQIVATLPTVKESVQWLKNNISPDLIFSDIQLGDALSFDIFQQLDIVVPIVFTTAYDEYAIQAFQHYSIDYLLKPIRVTQLQSAIVKYQNIKLQYALPDFQRLTESLSQKTYKSRFLIYHRDALIPIKAEEIAYFYTEDKVVFLKTKKGQRYLLQESLDELERQLDPENFFRANRQFIIALESITKVHQYFNRKLKLDLLPRFEKEVLISKEKATVFKQWLGQ